MFKAMQANLGMLASAEASAYGRAIAESKELRGIEQLKQGVLEAQGRATRETRSMLTQTMLGMLGAKATMMAAGAGDAETLGKFFGLRLEAEDLQLTAISSLDGALTEWAKTGNLQAFGTFGGVIGNAMTGGQQGIMLAEAGQRKAHSYPVTPTGYMALEVYKKSPGGKITRTLDDEVNHYVEITPTAKSLTLWRRAMEQEYADEIRTDRQPEYLRYNKTTSWNKARAKYAIGMDTSYLLNEARALFDGMEIDKAENEIERQAILIVQRWNKAETSISNKVAGAQFAEAMTGAASSKNAQTAQDVAIVLMAAGIDVKDIPVQKPGYTTSLMYLDKVVSIGKHKNQIDAVLQKLLGGEPVDMDTEAGKAYTQDFVNKKLDELDAKQKKQAMEDFEAGQEDENFLYHQFKIAFPDNKGVTLLTRMIRHVGGADTPTRPNPDAKELEDTIDSGLEIVQRVLMTAGTTMPDGKNKRDVATIQAYNLVLQINEVLMRKAAVNEKTGKKIPPEYLMNQIIEFFKQWDLWVQRPVEYPSLVSAKTGETLEKVKESVYVKPWYEWVRPVTKLTKETIEAYKPKKE